MKMQTSDQRSMVPNVTISNARAIFKNFTGVERQFNPPGKRNFGVILDDHELARALYDDGWNVKWLPPRDEDEQEQPWMPVELNFNPPPGSTIAPPVVVIIKNGLRRTLDEESIHILDWAEIESVDVTVRGYTGGKNFQWPAPGRPGVRGIKGFVKQLFIKIRVDELEAKYQDIPEEITRGDYDGN